MTAVAAVEDETSSKATNEVVNETATVIAPSDNAQADDNNGPPTNPPPIFIQGLSVLSPRQKSNSNNKAREETEETAVVPLPPLRPEEPIASIRGALSEVIGFAHLTKYRLVVERLTDDGKGTTTNVGTTSNNAATGMTSKSTKGGNGKHTKTQDRKKNSKGADNRNWSPFTLGNALVTVPPSRSLDIGDENNNREEKDEREEKDDDVDGELVLDEYSDLSLLLPLLERSSSSSSPSSSPTTDPSSTDDPSTDSKTTSNNTGADGSIVLNASHLSIRVVLERYDLASVKDHLGRVRGLAEGNAPYVVTLKGEDEEELASASVADGEIAGGGGDAMEKKKQQGGKDVKQTSEEKKETTEAEKQAEKQAEKEALAAALPSFAKDRYDVLLDSSARNGDLADFYYYACGEEETLLRLKEERKEGLNNNNKFGSDKDWLDDDDDNNNNNNDAVGNESKENKKKGSNNHGGKAQNNGRKKKKNDAKRNNNSKNNNSNNNHVSKKFVHNESIVRIERTLHELNESTRVPVSLRLSGYHPPPAHRRVLGDLAYLEATMPDGSVTFVTAFSLGFYVNRSTASAFDPTPMIASGNNSNSNNSNTGAEDACYSHSLLDCLLQRSPSLRSSWATALSAARERSDLLRELSLSEDSLYGMFRPAASAFDNNASGPAASAIVGGGMTLSVPRTFVPRIDSMVVRPSWLVPLPAEECGDMVGPRVNTWDHSRLHSYHVGEKEDSMMFGMDVRGGGLRDWNEELQTAREMPVESFGERIERARLVHKVLSDFGDAALSGTKAILDGYILPMNPNEPLRSHVYLHNNIFFSRAVDSGLDTFKIVQGDEAAKKSASRDAQNMGVLHRLDVPGLHTLATVLVEYLGTRIVCQSVVPGILHGEKSHSLLYGAVETLSALRCDEEMHELLENSIGEGCMVATRAIPAHPLTEERMEVIKKYRITPTLEKEGEGDDDKDELIRVCGPMEMKGILGSDKRRYVLDCTRLTPRDANWVGRAEGGTGCWEDALQGSGVKASKHIPSTLDDDEWTVCVLRPELVTNYAEMKISKYLAEHNGDDTKDSDKSKQVKEETQVPSEAVEESETPNKAVEEKDLVDAPETKEEGTGSNKLSKEALSKVEEEYIKSLRYNVNVFLPHTRSIEALDKGAHEKLKQDEEEARKLARHLWDNVLPNLTKEIRSSSGNGLQLPVDGRSLTELIHQRGVNCRYLGRLAELARKEEMEDVVAAERASSPDPSGRAEDAPRSKAPRFRMPLCWLEMLECEMVARAAKHVLDSYVSELGPASAAQVPAQTIASFLSAVVSVGEESAAETERRTGSKGSRAVLDQEDMNALTLFGVGGGEDGVIRGRDEIWLDIEREIGRRYRYTLSLYNRNSATSSKKGVRDSQAMYTPLLRRICQRSGIRIVAKHYSMGNKCVCGGGGGTSGGLAACHPIAPTDILDILPLVKHAASVSGESFVPCSFDGNTAGSSTSLHVLLSDAKTVYEFGHANLSNGNAGNVAVTLDCAQEAAAMYQRVLDSPIHPQISKCLKLTAVAHYHKEEPELAVAAAAKYLAVSISLHGFDSAEVLNAHLTMADILLGSGKIPEGVKHLRAAQFLMEFMAGKNYSGISSTYYRMGSHYYDAGKLEDALQFYKVAAARRSEDRMFDCLIARNSAGVLARLGQFKLAFDYEKKAYQLYVTFLGDEHNATKACSNTLIQLMKLAVEQEKKSKIQEKERVKESAADAVADQIRADEEAEEAQPTKKKKKQSKKRNKK